MSVTLHPRCHGSWPSAGLRCSIAPNQQIGETAGAISAKALDVANRAAVDGVARAIQAEHGAVDILVNRPGVNFRTRYWAEADGETFDKVVEIDLDGTTNCMLAVLGMQARREGAVINIASFAGWHLTRRRQRHARDGASPRRGGNADPQAAPGRAKR